MTATATTTAQALRLLAAEIQAPDDVPACCLRDAADLIAAQAAEIEALRSAMLSALSATRAKVEDDISTEWLCLGADEIRLCIRRMDQERAGQTARADKAEARVEKLEALLRKIIAEWRCRSEGIPRGGYHESSAANLAESDTLDRCADDIAAAIAPPTAAGADGGEGGR